MPHAENSRFVRPCGFTPWRLLNKLLPPQPEDQVALGFKNLQKLRARDYAQALAMLVTFVAIVAIQVRLVPALLWSPALLAAHSTQWAVRTFNMSSEFILILTAGWAMSMLILLVVFGANFHRFIARRYSRRPSWIASIFVAEEQWFREGAESWNPWQRITSCVCYGLMQLTLLFMPLASLVPYILLGATLMWVYLRAYRKTRSRHQAVLRTSTLNRLYTLIALSWSTASVISLFTGHFILDYFL